MMTIIHLLFVSWFK